MVVMRSHEKFFTEKQTIPNRSVICVIWNVWQTWLRTHVGNVRSFAAVRENFERKDLSTLRVMRVWKKFRPALCNQARRKSLTSLGSRTNRTCDCILLKVKWWRSEHTTFFILHKQLGQTLTNLQVKYFEHNYLRAEFSRRSRRESINYHFHRLGLFRC